MPIDQMIHFIVRYPKVNLILQIVGKYHSMLRLLL